MGSALSTLSARETTQQSQPVGDPDWPDHALTTHQTGLYPQLLLFGDSITQDATSTLQPRLQTLYVRRADVVNRGFSGYNSVLALETIPRFLPPPPANCLANQAPIRLVTLFFGANDAALPGNAQHVPLSLYTASLKAIAQYPAFKQHGTRIVIITPAPVDEWQLSKPLNRTAVSAHRYAEAARQLAGDLNLPCVDLWTAFAKLAGYKPTTCDGGRIRCTGNARGARDEIVQGVEKEEYGQCLSAEKETMSDSLPELLPGDILAPPNEVLASLLSDGLHFTSRGYDVLYNELMALIRDEIPECMPERMPFVFQSWRDILRVPKQEDMKSNVRKGLAPYNQRAGIDEGDEARYSLDNRACIDLHLAAGGISAQDMCRNTNVSINSETHTRRTTKLDTCIDYLQV